jgi:uncharacterized protein YndB with AHSA1/START domain
MQKFIYVTYIKTTPERLWQALTDNEVMRQYWFGAQADCNWAPGSPWNLHFSNGVTMDSGEILEIEPPRRLVIKWRHEFFPE